MSITDEERQAASDLWAELGRQEACHPTPEQLLAFMRRCSDSVGLDLAARVIAAQQEASHCWIADHVGRLRFVESQLAAVYAWIAGDQPAQAEP